VASLAALFVVAAWVGGNVWALWGGVGCHVGCEWRGEVGRGGRPPGSTATVIAVYTLTPTPTPTTTPSSTYTITTHPSPPRPPPLGCGGG
jgi:hypothetical protein